MLKNLHWLELSEYMAIALAVVGTIAASASSSWSYACVPICMALVLNAIVRARWQQQLRTHDRAIERKLDTDLQQQGEILQQEIAQARSFAAALVKQTTLSQKSPLALTSSDSPPESLEQKFAAQQQLMQSMQEHVAGVEGTLKDAIDLLESNGLTDRVEYLERHLTQVSQQLGLNPGIDAMLPADGEPDIDIQPLLDMISEDLMSSELMSDNLSVSGELSGDLWSKPTWHLHQSIEAHQDWVRCLCFTPDGTKLASGSFDKSIKVWQLDTGAAVHTFSEGLKGVFALAVSADSQLLASGSWDETIDLWDLDSGRQVERLAQHQAAVRSLAISPDGKTLVGGSSDCTISLWQLPERRLQQIITDREPIAAMALSPDGQFLASTGDDGTVKLWSLATGAQMAIASDNKHCIGTLAIAPDGRSIAAGTTNGYIILWRIRDLDAERPQIDRAQTIKAHAGQINACIFSPDGQYLISGSVDGKAKVWYRGEDSNFRDKARSILKGDPGRSVMSVAISPSGEAIAVGGADGTIQLWQRM